MPGERALGPSWVTWVTPQKPSALTCSPELEVSSADLRTGSLSSPFPRNPLLELDLQNRPVRYRATLPFAQGDAGPWPARAPFCSGDRELEPQRFSAWSLQLAFTGGNAALPQRVGFAPHGFKTAHAV